MAVVALAGIAHAQQMPLPDATPLRDLAKLRIGSTQITNQTELELDGFRQAHPDVAAAVNSLDLAAHHDVAVEASFSTADRYTLRPLAATTPRGVGLSLGSTPALASRTWNADVYTSWSFQKSFSLYGRLGYAQSDALPSYALAALPPSETRTLRNGVNYGLGVRYDVTPALGLRLEYARFSRFAGEAVAGPLPESDQVQLGMQFRF